MQRKAAPAAADIEHSHARRKREFGRDVIHLRHLGLFERGDALCPISARILAVGIKEEIVKPVVQIIIIGDIAARRGALVHLIHAVHDSDADLFEQTQIVEIAVLVSRGLLRRMKLTKSSISPPSIVRRPSMKASAIPRLGLRAIAPGTRASWNR
jgi:hypothetical protein